MRKILIFLFTLIIASSVSAQRASDSDLNWYESDINHSGVFTDASAGIFTGGTDFGLSLKLGYRLNIYDGLSWDTISVGSGSGISEFMDYLTLRLLTGFRYNTNEDLIGKSLYANVGLGYCMAIDDTEIEGNSFAFEIGAGINLSRLISVGIVWEGSTFDWGIAGIKLGLNF